MAVNKQAGFTLVELVLVLAISGSLLVMAFIGQRGLRSRAQFDADVNKLVSSIADAHNQSTAAVNIDGPGDGTQNCATTVVANANYVFAGVAWSGLDNAAGSTFSMTFYAADRTAGTACVFDTRTIAVQSDKIRVNPAPGTGVAKSLFVRDDSGGLNVCAVTAAATNVLTSFQAGGCAGGAVANTALVINLSDADGHTSQIQVDPSGLAKRIN
ncbi:MAG TPA: type II secretion system protein [Candidatus Saccharimonadia bacterium]|jgi:prepilin-type N-terminal cleavage/methylation domain-containing protein|nr:type II secretion system protein [Candidatus Saccharimonadia bacterium]